MAIEDTTYDVPTLAAPGNTIDVEDEDEGSDWLIMSGTYMQQTSITLKWSSLNDLPVSAAGTYYVDNTNTAGRLVVTGVIENVRGSNSRDDIIGNQVGNIIYGDQDRTGAGGDDVISADIGDDTVYGGAGNDSIGGDAGADRLYGDAGNDTISGGGDADVIEGGAGADVLSGGADAEDTVSYEASSAGVTISLTFGSTTTGSGGDAQDDTINGFLNVIGSELNDVITDTVAGNQAPQNGDNAFDGRGGNDILNLGGSNDIGIGGAGKDKLTGGLGADTLTGGTQKDLFIFTRAGDSAVAMSGRDTITDFSRSDKDEIDLHLIDANSKKGGNQAFEFIGDHAFSKQAGELRIKESGDGYLVQGDINGDRKADFAIFVDNVNALKSGDFDM